MKLRPAAVWRMRASPAPGLPSSISSHLRTSGPPVLWKRIACGIAYPPGIHRLVACHFTSITTQIATDSARKAAKLPARCGAAARAAGTSPWRSLRSPQVGQQCLAQIELAFDAAPRFVLEFAGAVQVVDPLTLGFDQQKLNLVVLLHCALVRLVTVAAVLDILEPVMVSLAQRPKQILRQLALGGAFVETAAGRLDRQTSD